MKLFYVCTFLILFFLIIPCGNATEEMAEKTGKDCSYCHLDQSGGGELTKAGKEYLTTESESDEDAQGKGILHYIRFIAGFLHIFTAIFWFGTILYVHLILKPQYAARGLPRGEVKVGFVSMIVMAVTGITLTVFRVPSFSFLFETRFGILLLVKIFLFLIMVCSALYVVLIVGPKLGMKKDIKFQEPKEYYTADELRNFDGVKGHPAYMAFNNKIYDVSKSSFWKDGKHFAKHSAGTDLRGMLDQAPHGEEKLKGLDQIGKLALIKTKEEIPSQERVFYFIAYMNLGLVILITLILALWRWW
jgi:predicted heme/steroid binding protein